jgi:hypothetical protein
MKQSDAVAQAQSDIKARKNPLFSASFGGQSDLGKCLFDLLLVDARRIDVGFHLSSYHLSRF